MTKAFTIIEAEDNYAKYSAGQGVLDLYENMPDELILKLIKKAVKKAEGAPFTVCMLPDWNKDSNTETCNT